MQALIADIRAYALENYDDPSYGWDYVIEAYTDDELRAEIGNVRTLAGAIRKLKPIVQMLRDRDRSGY